MTFFELPDAQLLELPGLEVGGQWPEARGRRPELRGQSPEARARRPETGGQSPEARGQCQRQVPGRQRPEARGQAGGERAVPGGLVLPVC